MAIIVENGSGLSTADSYLSVADADTYHAAHGSPAAWTAATTGAKESALQLATQYLDLNYEFQWFGTRINETMALDWPRYGVVDRDGFTVSATAVPLQVKHATAYLALQVVNGDSLIPTVAAGSNIASESVTVGPITTSKSYLGEKSAAKHYPMVERFLSSLIGGHNRVYRA